MTAPTPSPVGRSPRAGRLRRRPVVVLATLVTAAALLAVASRPWVRADLVTPLGGASGVDVSGSQAVPVVTACALVALAAAGALSIAGRRARVVVLVVAVLAGVAALGSTVGVLRDPAGAARDRVATTLGVTPTSVVEGSASVGTTGWVWVGAVLGVVVVVLAVGGLVASRSWVTRDRYAAPAAAAATPEPATADDDPAASWDALTRGLDPTEAPTAGGGRLGADRPLDGVGVDDDGNEHG